MASIQSKGITQVPGLVHSMVKALRARKGKKPPKPNKYTLSLGKGMSNASMNKSLGY